MILILSFIPVVLLCLFLLFIFSKQDFVLLRQNISLAQIFDLAAISFIIAIITGRVLSIVNDATFGLFHVLQFFHLLRFPGVSFLGIVLGGALGIFILFRKKKGLPRIYDIFAISFFPLLVFYAASQFLSVGLWYVSIISVIVLVLIFMFFLDSHKKYILRDGSLGLIFLLIATVLNFTLQFFGAKVHHIIFNLSLLQIFGVPIICFCLYLIVTNQKKKK